MKKQYTVYENLFYRSTIRTYHDGKHIETYYKWNDEAEKFIKDLEAEGYTFAFTKQELDKIKEQYEYMIDKVLVEEKTFPKIPIEHNIEICKNCQSYSGCVNAILRHPEWQVKCIRFGFLTKEILKEKNDDIPK